MVVLAKYERVNENKLHGSTGGTSAGTKDAVHTLEHRFRLSRGVAGLTNNRQPYTTTSSRCVQYGTRIKIGPMHQNNVKMHRVYFT